jgi:hypothetical protein
MTITTEDCKLFIKQYSKSPHHSTAQWKRIRKYKKGNLILRDFSNNYGDILTVCEDEIETLSFYKPDITGNRMQSNWLKILTAHFSDPCYKDEVYDPESICEPERMLVEYLSHIQHGMKHNDIKRHEVYFYTTSSVTLLVFHVVINLEKHLLMIDVKELKEYGYTPKENQSGYDFVSENFNWY